MKTPKINRCSNCENTTSFQRIDGLYALTEVKKDGENIAFLPASGIPVIVFICAKCGEIKLFPAKLFEEI